MTTDDSRLGMAKIQVMNRSSVVGDIVSQLLNFLVSERIGPGDKLPSERALSQHLGLGRSSVREAVKTLHVLGLVDVKLGDGTYLRGTESAVLPQILEWGLVLSQPHTEDLVEARNHLEVFVARRASELITTEGSRGLDACIERMARAEATGNREACVKTDVDFHLALAEIAGNAVIADMLRSIRVLLHVWMSRLVMSEGVSDFANQHRLLADAVESGDADAAERMMRHHIGSAGERLLKLPAAEDAEPAAAPGES